MLLSIGNTFATEQIGIKFTRNGIDLSNATINITDKNGDTLQGTSATIESSHTLKTTANNVTDDIICPDININTSSAISLILKLTNLPENFTFNAVALDIYALNNANSYQSNNDGKNRQINITAKHGNTDLTMETIGTLSNIDIASGVGTNGAVHKEWLIKSDSTIKSSNSMTLQLTITKGDENSGCFFGKTADVSSDYPEFYKKQSKQQETHQQRNIPHNISAIIHIKTEKRLIEPFFCFYMD